MVLWGEENYICVLCCRKTFRSARSLRRDVNDSLPLSLLTPPPLRQHSCVGGRSERETDMNVHTEAEEKVKVHGAEKASERAGRNFSL